MNKQPTLTPNEPQLRQNWPEMTPKRPPKEYPGTPQGPQGTPVPSCFPLHFPEASKHSNSHTDWDPPRAPRDALINRCIPWTPRYHPPVFTSNYTTLAPYSQAPLLEHFPSELPRTPRPCGVGGSSGLRPLPPTPKESRTIWIASAQVVMLRYIFLRGETFLFTK